MAPFEFKFKSEKRSGPKIIKINRKSFHRISPEELQSLLKKHNIPISLEEAQRLLKEGKLEKKIERKFTLERMNLKSRNIEELFYEGKLIKRKTERKEISLSRLIFILVGILIILFLFLRDFFLKKR